MFLYPVGKNRGATFSVHADDEPCPFAEDGTSFGMGEPCCALQVEPPVLYLTFFGLARTAAKLITDKSGVQALRFGRELHGVAKQLGLELNLFVLHRQMASGIPVDIAISGVDWHVNPIEALRAIETAACWHEKVGKMGFAVRSRDRND